MIELDEILEVLEVLRDEGETLVVEGVGGGIFVLVEGVEMSGGEVFEDGTGMSAATKGDVGLYAFGVNVQAPDTFLQHDRFVIHHSYS